MSASNRRWMTIAVYRPFWSVRVHGVRCHRFLFTKWMFEIEIFDNKVIITSTDRDKLPSEWNSLCSDQSLRPVSLWFDGECFHPDESRPFAVVRCVRWGTHDADDATLCCNSWSTFCPIDGFYEWREFVCLTWSSLRKSVQCVRRNDVARLNYWTHRMAFPMSFRRGCCILDGADDWQRQPMHRWPINLHDLQLPKGIPSGQRHRTLECRKIPDFWHRTVANVVGLMVHGPATEVIASSRYCLRDRRMCPTTKHHSPVGIRTHEINKRKMKKTTYRRHLKHQQLADSGVNSINLIPWHWRIIFGHMWSWLRLFRFR